MVSPSTPAAILEATTAVQSIEDKAVVEVNEALKEDLNLTLE
jgi:hypothetical protein